MRRLLKGNDFRGNYIQQLFFCWMDPLLWKGFRRDINETDLHECATDIESEKLYANFEKTWTRERTKVQKGGKASLILALAKATYLKLIMCTSIITLQSFALLAISIFYLYFTQTCNVTNKVSNLSTVNVIIMGKSKIEEREILTSLGWAITLSISIFISIMLNSVGYTYSFIYGMQLRIICIGALYKKILRLQQTTIFKLSIGHIFNVMSNDVQRFDFITEFFGTVLILIVQLPIIIIIILIYIGPIGLIGLFIVVVHLPIQMVLTKIFGYFKKKFCESTDERTKMMDQIIKGMRVIKMYGWETAFLEYVSKLRANEVTYTILCGLTQSNTISFNGTNLFEGLFVTYIVSIAIGNPLSPSTIGLYLLFLNIVRYYIVYLIGQLLFFGIEILISCKRIQYILEMPENIQTCIEYKPIRDKANVYFKDYTATWKEIDTAGKGCTKVLNALNFEITGSSLCLLAGPVGSGKSSLLMSIINELTGQEGKLEITGSISYAPQEAWIFSGTIRENILLKNVLTSERYNRVLEITCLNKDIQSLEDGDLSLIGERGITLSGGQKARVTLARALYREADIYLLDDPLSAVDAIVGRCIFKNAIRGFLNGKLVVLVTHLIHFANLSDYVVVMEKGKIISQGVSGHIIKEVASKSVTFQNESENRNVPFNQENIELSSLDLELNRMYDNRNIITDKNTSTLEHQTLSKALMKEDTQSGSVGSVCSVSFHTYLKYFTIGGYIWPILLIIAIIISNGGRLASLWYMQEWSRCHYCGINTQISSSNIFYSNLSECANCYRFTTVSTSHHIMYYSILTVAGIVSTFVQGWLVCFITLRASRILHNKMLCNIICAPVRFFDTNPGGRILNRFTKDVGFMDEQIPIHFIDFIHEATFIFSSLLSVCFVQIVLIIPIILFLIGLLAIRYYFLKACRQIKRFESNARSPLYSHILMTLQGLKTIRSFFFQERMAVDYFYLQNNHSRGWFDFRMGIRWFGFRIDLLSFVLIIFAIFSAFTARCVFNYHELIEYSLSLLFVIPVSVLCSLRLSGQIEIFMVSVERIIEYTKINREAHFEPRHDYVQGIPLCDNGTINFNNVSFRYADELPYSLRNITLTINAGEKVGIIGRTGAGKSSLFSALFRLNEIDQGIITINGINISTLPLHTLRKSISIIPQDAFLFSGTLRYNLDPFSEYSDYEIWQSLKQSSLNEMVRGLDGQLLANVYEDGQNFSAGQRQLVCLARALLRKNKIIVIDEATANVDRETDELLQKAIREVFADCTVLTIAHRLETIMDSDRILVMDEGRVAEFDTTSNLLKNPFSLLSIQISQINS